jgi:hypothetical protein
MRGDPPPDMKMTPDRGWALASLARVAAPPRPPRLAPQVDPGDPGEVSSRPQVGVAGTITGRKIVSLT